MSRMEAARERQARAELAALAEQRRRHTPSRNYPDTPWLVRWLEEHAGDWLPIDDDLHQRVVPAKPPRRPVPEPLPPLPRPRPRPLGANNDSVKAVLAIERLINDGRQLSKV